jgi:putative sigma-54 modulation protein
MEGVAMSVDVEVQASGFNVNERLEDYVHKKAGKLDRYLAELEGARVELTHMKSARQASDRFVAQITLRGKKVMLRAEERADDVYVAFDAAMEKVQRRIERYKGKRYRGKGNRVSVGEAAMEIIEEELAAEMAAEEEPEITRRKKFTLYPMNEFEALEQMELLGHEDFFIFFNMDTNSVNVLYHRRDGSYGLIDTELA